MPNALVKSYAKETGKSEAHIEGWWKEAEEQALKKFKKSDPRFYAYVNGIVEKRGKLVHGKKRKKKRTNEDGSVFTFKSFLAEAKEQEVSKASKLVYAALGKMDADDLKPYHKKIHVRQNDNLVTVKFKMTDIRGAFTRVFGMDTLSGSTRKNESALFTKFAKELEKTLKSMVNIEDSSVDETNSDVELFFVTDDVL